MQQSERWNDPQEALAQAMDGRQASMWTAMPGIVKSRTGNNVSVQLAIQEQTQDKVTGKITNVSLPLLVNVPLMTPGGGGFGVTLPIAEGDEVLVHFASRCIDGWWQNGGIQPQIEKRMHDLSDGFAMPAPMSNPKAMPNISDTSAQLRSNDGTTFIEVAPGGVNVTTSKDVNVNATGNVTIVAPNITLTGQVVVNGSISIEDGGSLTAQGSIEAGLGSGDAVTLQHHTHSGGAPPTPGT